MDPSKYYRPTKACRNGHLALRRISDSVCVECEHARLLKWKRKNAEHVRDRDRRQKSKDPSKLREQGRARYAADPEYHRAKAKRHYDKHPERLKARRRAYHHATYPRDEEMRAEAQVRAREWALKNPEKAKQNTRNGKAKRRNVPGQHTVEDIERIMKQQRGRCAYCRIRLGTYHIDHVQPVSKGGTNYARNIQLTCVKCNLEKSARDPIVHAQKIGLLL